jgi:uncharacterized protein YoxC
MDTLIAETQLLVVIATVAIIVLTILLSLAITRLTSILTDVDSITKKIRTETDLVAQDIADLRDKLSSFSWLSYLTSFFHKQRSRKLRKDEEE